MRLKGKSALITGAASGIGQAIARLFAREGARVTVADIDSKRGTETVAAIKEFGGEAIFVHSDVSILSEVEATISTTVEAFGGLNVLVNNAAIWQRDGYIHDVNEEAWDDILKGSLKSTYLCSRAALPYMIKGRGGSIINISSINALMGVHLTAYTAAKGGILSLTRLLAVHYGRKGVRANAICPGTIDTESSRLEYERNPSLQGIRQKLIDLTQLGRIGKPEDIAYCALYLASDESAFTTGAVFVIDGGASAGLNLNLG